MIRGSVWKASKVPTIRMTRANGRAVFDHKESGVPTLDWMVRAGPGQARCTVCGMVFEPNKRTISKHPESERHRKALDAQNRRQG